MEATPQERKLLQVLEYHKKSIKLIEDYLKTKDIPLTESPYKIPYEKFKKVVDEKNRLKEENKILKEQLDKLRSK